MTQPNAASARLFWRLYSPANGATFALPEPGRYARIDALNWAAHVARDFQRRNGKGALERARLRLEAYNPCERAWQPEGAWVCDADVRERADALEAAARRMAAERDEERIQALNRANALRQGGVR